jgi:hypothetical protein
MPPTETVPFAAPAPLYSRPLGGPKADENFLYYNSDRSAYGGGRGGRGGGGSGGTGGGGGGGGRGGWDDGGGWNDGSGFIFKPKPKPSAPVPSGAAGPSTANDELSEAMEAVDYQFEPIAARTRSSSRTGAPPLLAQPATAAFSHTPTESHTLAAQEEYESKSSDISIQSAADMSDMDMGTQSAVETNDTETQNDVKTNDFGTQNGVETSESQTQAGAQTDKVAVRTLLQELQFDEVSITALLRAWRGDDAEIRSMDAEIDTLLKEVAEAEGLAEVSTGLTRRVVTELQLTQTHVAALQREVAQMEEIVAVKTAAIGTLREWNANAKAAGDAAQATGAHELATAVQRLAQHQKEMRALQRRNTQLLRQLETAELRGGKAQEDRRKYRRVV